MTYTWDARDRLVSLQGSGLVVAFEYDAFGRRARKDINGTPVEFLYDGLNLAQEVRGVQTVSKETGSDLGRPSG